MEQINISPTEHKSMEKDKPYFGAYLNLARNNAFLTLEYIHSKVGLELPLNKEDALHEAPIFDYLTNDKRPDDTAKIIRLLDEKFPWLKAYLRFDEEGNELDEPPKPQQYEDTMKLVLEHLNTYRNFFTHAEHKDYCTKKDLVAVLRNVFDAARREAKKRFSFTKEDVEHLVREEKINDPSGKKGKNGRPIKVVREKPDFHFPFWQEENITEKGLAFFICLFLQKDDCFKFLQKLYGFNKTATPKDRATLETYSILGLKLPQVRLESTDNQMAVTLDMVNELKRCPNVLFNHLKPADRKKFEITLTEDGQLNDANTEEELEAEVVMKRSSERFNYFALRYLDDTNAFKNLRFQVNLGNYYHTVYPKTIDGEQRIRRLKTALRSYGRLHDFLTNEKPEQWQPLLKKTHDIKKGHDQPYIVDTNPHYNITENRIGLVNISDKKFSHFNENNGWTDLDKKPWRIQPDYWLSVYELPALCFYQWITKKHGNDHAAESLIEKHTERIEDFLKKVANGEIHAGMNRAEFDTLLVDNELRPDHVPDDIKKYLLERPKRSFEECAEERLQNMLEETKALLDERQLLISQSKEKPGKGFYKPLRAGDMATWLAKDMIKLQVPYNGDNEKTSAGRANSKEYQVLQARLALFGRDKHLLKRAFTMCRLIDSENPHPFLKKLVPEKYQGILSFYQAYLKERQHFIEKCIREKNYSAYYFLGFSEKDKKQKDAAYYKGLANTIAESPVNLPRALFKDALVDFFKAKGAAAMKAAIEETEQVNSIYLIDKYFELERNDSNQPFYDWPRSYKIVNQLLDETNALKRRKAVPKLYMTSDELASRFDSLKKAVKAQKEKEQKKNNNRSKHTETLIPNAKHKLSAYLDNEKLIRFIKTSDQILFLMAEEMLNSFDNQLNVNVADEKFKLSDVSPELDKGILSKQVSFEMELPFQDKESGINGKRTIREPEMKFKNYGKFRRFLKDRRLNSLLPYYPKNKPILKSELEKELDNYERVRLKVFAIIHEFEAAMIEKHRNELVKNDTTFVGHRPILSLFYKQYEPNGMTKKKLIELRNKFCHSQYPPYHLFSEYILKDKGSVAKQFLIMVEETYGYFVKMLSEKDR